MADLTRGANAPLTTGTVEVAVSGARQGAVDLMVFQLGSDRKVRSDADFVFFNQPASPEGAVRLVAADRITADLTAVPAAVETLAVAVALDDTVAGSLAGIAGLGVTVTVTVSGGEVHHAPATGLTSERAAVLVEIYRRAGGWKVRNVSAGWSAGLSALVTEHGVSVDDEPAPPPAASPGARPVTPAAQPTYPPQSAQPMYPPQAQPQPMYQPQPAQPTYPPQPAAASSGARSSGASAVPPGWRPPGGYPPPGGSLPPRPEFVPPQPGGWRPPGGSLAGPR